MTEAAPAAHQPNLWDKIWRDKQGAGKIVIFQLPNWPLLLWLGLMVIPQFAKGQLSSGATIAASVVIIIWGVWELTKGDNYFRRSLGAVVILFSIASLSKIIFG
ncbi:MAG: hypothetical protein ABI602_00340 [Candidatus Saccharibacteria bacterium]